MGLASEAAGRAEAGGIHKARASGGEAEILLAEVQLAHIVVALAAVLVGGDVAGPGGMVGLQRELGGDFLEGVLRVGKAELVAEEGGFGGPAIRGRGRGDVVERGLNVLLRLLDQVGEVEHVRAGQRRGGEGRLCDW